MVIQPDVFIAALGQLIAIVDPRSEPTVVSGQGSKESVLLVRLYGAEGTVVLRGRRLTWSRSFPESSDGEARQSGANERLFPWGYAFTVGDASVAVVAAITRDLIAIEQSYAQGRDTTDFVDLTERVDANISRLAGLGSLPGVGLSEKQRQVATRRATELWVLSNAARSHSET